MDEKRPVRQWLTAAGFLIVLAGCTLFWLWGVRDDLGALTWETLKTLPTQAEETINDALDRDHAWIQFYGGVQRLLGRRVLQDVDPTYTVYKLSDGSLSFVNPAPADCISDNADAYLTFQETLKARGVSLLYLQAPQKLNTQEGPSLPVGATDYGNQNADALLERISQGGGASLDLRQVLADSDRPWASWFFATDHHWTPQAALLCTGAVVEYLNERGGLELDASLLDPDRYTVEVYEDLFLGSQGKRVGTLYAGLDDFSVWTPDFATSFTYETPYEVRQGAFGDTLLFQERLEGDVFDANPYALYSGGDYGVARITNELNPDGPKLLLLRDSYGCALAPFLALTCGELTTVDLRYLDGDLMEYVDEADPDCVLILYSPGSLKTTTAFQFQ
jgi:hypothetical protein